MSQARTKGKVARPRRAPRSKTAAPITGRDLAAGLVGFVAGLAVGGGGGARDGGPRCASCGRPRAAHCLCGGETCGGDHLCRRFVVATEPGPTTFDGPGSPDDLMTRLAARIGDRLGGGRKP